MPKNGKLTEKDKAFCRNYVASNHGTASYMNAFEVGYDSARTGASRLLTRDNIQEYIQELKNISQANYAIATNELRDEIIKSIKSQLLLSKLIEDICFSKGKEAKTPEGNYNISENMFNAISRGAESASRLNKSARENLILLSGLESVADEILNKNKS